MASVTVSEQAQTTYVPVKRFNIQLCQVHVIVGFWDQCTVFSPLLGTNNSARPNIKIDECGPLGPNEFSLGWNSRKAKSVADHIGNNRTK